MQNYELVLLLDASAQEKERKQIIDDIEGQFKDAIKEKDEIGLRSTSYGLDGKQANTKFYFYSYLLDIKSEDVSLIKKSLLYNKVVARYFVFKKTPSEQFMKFDDLQKILQNVIDGWEERKKGQKVVFFKNKDNKKYISWKALPMLKKYVTRFGDIKPRKYTGNPVNVQKALRIAIIRAREIGVLEYIK